ncbi:MAG: hypothetical protein JXP34_22315 [Planctomycetes bacterium]|nr:hypothetical protein [Planctomycetota bacterium]
MAHLWRNGSGEGWKVVPLDHDTHAIPCEGAGRPPVEEMSHGDNGAVIVRHRSSTGDGEVWILLAPRGSAIRINGVPDGMGMHILRDRDEILAPGAGRLFFSTERRPEIVPYPETEGPRFCARCRQAIAAGTPAVRCACGLWHHESAGLPCWTYAERCSGCPAPTSLDGRFRWSPEEL